MVKDIRPEGSSNPWSLTDVDGTLFFLADDPLHPSNVGNSGSELWKSDGTEAGTVLVKDINPAPGTAFAGGLTNVGGTLFFGADDGTNGRALWKSDGTEDGTVLVKDINPGSLTNVGGTLFFSGDRSELWKSDGTEAGTVMVKDVIPVSAGSDFLDDLANVGDALFFTAGDETHGRELWTSDGTADGTVMVKDINPDGPSWPSLPIDVDGTAFFTADDGAHGRELWKSDGTEDGTVMVKDVSPPPGGAGNLTNVGGTLFFVAYDGTGDGTGGSGGGDLWKSDGTAEGSVLVRDIPPPPETVDRTIGLRPRPLRNRGIAQGVVRQYGASRPGCVRGVAVRVQRRPLEGGAWRTIRQPRTDRRGLYRTAKRILRPNGQPRPGRYRAIAPRFPFKGPDDIQVICQRAVSIPWRRVPRR
jgi:ELWxxDGT repeat protein